VLHRTAGHVATDCAVDAVFDSAGSPIGAVWRSIRKHQYLAGATRAASPPDGSIGRALDGATDESWDARGCGVAAGSVATSSDPQRRLGGAKARRRERCGRSEEELARRLRFHR
jgi:hypothetical protein